MYSNAIRILGFFCFVAAAKAAGYGVRNRTGVAGPKDNPYAGVYDDCQNCIATAEKIFLVSEELREDGINFYGLPVPCGLLEEDSVICDRLLDDVEELHDCAICDAYKMCSKIKYCYTNSKLTTPTPFPPAPKPFVVTNRTVNVDIFADAFCFGCKKIMRYTRAVSKHENKPEISSTLVNVCDQYRGILRVYCITLLNQQRDNLINMLWERLPPATICDNMDQCNFPYCKACYDFVSELKTNEAALSESACSYLTPVMGHFCSESLNHNRELMHKLIHKIDFTAYKICYATAYCPRRTRAQFLIGHNEHFDSE